MDELKHAVIHSLIKEAQTNIAAARMAPNNLDVADANVISLSEQLARLVGKDGSTVYWGQFGNNNREGRFPAAAETLSADISADAFTNACNVAMAELVQTAQNEQLATGGHVCFLVYSSNGADFLLIAMIKEKGALTLSELLVPTEIREIDLSKLHQAARINLYRYSDFLEHGQEAEDVDNLERTYLCFINRNTRSDVAKYFIQALGCEKGISSARTTRNAIDGVKKFFKSKPETKQKAMAVRRAVIDHLSVLPDGAAVSITTIVNVTRVALGEDLAHYADDLTQYLNSEKVQVPESFNVSSQFLKTVRRIVAKAEGWQMSFDDTVVGEADSPIIYDRNEHSLKITNPPQDVIKRVEEVISSRRE